MKANYKDTPLDGCCVSLPGRQSQIFVPRRRCELVAGNHEHRAPAEECIFVPPTASVLRVRLDDGRGLGFPFPQYVERVILALARKGADFWSCVLPVGGIEAPNTIVVRLEGEDWFNLPPGFYDAQIRFQMGADTMIGRPVNKGWLLLYKEPPSQVHAVTASIEEPRVEFDKGFIKPGHKVNT